MVLVFFYSLIAFSAVLNVHNPELIFVELAKEAPQLWRHSCVCIRSDGGLGEVRSWLDPCLSLVG